LVRQLATTAFNTLTGTVNPILLAAATAVIVSSATSLVRRTAA
jgi:hypothetical protein